MSDGHKFGLGDILTPTHEWQRRGAPWQGKWEVVGRYTNPSSYTTGINYKCINVDTKKAMDWWEGYFEEAQEKPLTKEELLIKKINQLWLRQDYVKNKACVLKESVI